MRRIEIDLNIRRAEGTFAGYEDADGPLFVGQDVIVYESESGLEGPGRVERLDDAKRLVYLSLDWSQLR